MTTQKIPQETKTLIYKSTIQEAKTTHTQNDKTRSKNTKLYFCPKQQIKQETMISLYSPCDLTKHTTATITLPSLYRNIFRIIFIKRRTIKKL